MRNLRQTLKYRMHVVLWQDVVRRGNSGQCVFVRSIAAPQDSCEVLDVLRVGGLALWAGDSPNLLRGSI
jgi:hypothetical protein